MSDVMHGAGVVVGDERKRKTYLIGIIDDAARLVPYAAFAMDENTASVTGVFCEAFDSTLGEKHILELGQPYVGVTLAVVKAAR